MKRAVEQTLGAAETVFRAESTGMIQDSAVSNAQSDSGPQATPGSQAKPGLLASSPNMLFYTVYTQPTAAVNQYSVPKKPGDISLYGLGSPQGVARLIFRLEKQLAAARDTQPAPGQCSVGTYSALDKVVQYSLPRGTREEVRYLAASGLGPLPTAFVHEVTSNWDQMAIGPDDLAQDIARQEAVVEITGDQQAIDAAYQTAAPDGNLPPDQPGTRWWAWYGQPLGLESLVTGQACGVVGASRWAQGSGWTLGSVGSHEACRGQGIAAAVTAAASRALLRDQAGQPDQPDQPVVSLELYADNEAARRLYLKLGFSLVRQCESLRLPGDTSCGQ